jgi:hypothetical protein
LAYHLLISIEYTLRSHGDHRRWSTIREQLATHQRNTVIFTDADNKIHHLRVSGTPEKEHREIYRLLGVKDPSKGGIIWPDRGCSDQIKMRNAVTTRVLGFQIESWVSVFLCALCGKNSFIYPAGRWKRQQ